MPVKKEHIEAGSQIARGYTQGVFGAAELIPGVILNPNQGKDLLLDSIKIPETWVDTWGKPPLPPDQHPVGAAMRTDVQHFLHNLTDHGIAGFGGSILTIAGIYMLFKAGGNTTLAWLKFRSI